MGWKGRLVVALGVLMVVIGGLVVATLLVGPAAGSALGLRSADPSQLPPGLAKLDAPSRALSEELDPGEVVTATLMAGTDQRSVLISRRARELGLEASTLGDRPQVAVTGPLESVLEVSALVVVSGGYLSEDTRALRSVAAPLGPERSLPLAGSPYRDEELPVDSALITVPAAQRTALIAQLADMIITIDGRPYAQVWVEGSCDDALTCYVTLQGASVAGGEQRDYWPLRASPSTGWFGIVDPANPPVLGAVPRWLGREAERIARSDPGALARIREFDSIAGFAWEPATPGLIEVRYVGSCATGGRHVASLAIGPIADTGDVGCEQTLVVGVDVAGGRVLAIR